VIAICFRSPLERERARVGTGHLRFRLVRERNITADPGLHFKLVETRFSQNF